MAICKQQSPQNSSGGISLKTEVCSRGGQHSQGLRDRLKEQDSKKWTQDSRSTSETRHLPGRKCMPGRGPTFFPICWDFFGAFPPHLTVQVDKGAQVCHARQSLGVLRQEANFCSSWETGRRPQMKRTGKFSTCLGREREKDSFPPRM